MSEATEENQLIAQRREKLAALRQAGVAFPNDFRRENLAQELHDQCADKDKEALEGEAIEVRIAGRLMAKRIMGKASFAQLQDMSGRIQLFLQKAALGEAVYEQFKHMDIGDIVAAVGVVFRTKTGELSVKVSELRLLTKSLRPLPEKFHGLQDQEQRYRMRYLDLMMNEASRERFILRSRIVDYIRRFLMARDFLEVETPMMQVIPGGATAKPFVTHHNALDIPLYLRIAPELYLKRLVVGGMEKVFEINRNFRNEGLSTRHNPEFTMLEFYWAYADYRDAMDLTEDLLRGMAKDLLGTTEVVTEDGQSTYDFSQPFARMTLLGSITHFAPEYTQEALSDMDSACEIARSLKIEVKPTWGLGKVQTEIFEAVVEHRLMAPTFITEYPTEVSPLSRLNDDNPHVTDRFEFFVGGRELANGFSELNDAEDQAERFSAQVAEKDAGDEEAMHYDADYVRALEYGLPPTVGEGIGIDRLVMLMTATASIKDVILFPHMKPEAPQG